MADNGKTRTWTFTNYKMDEDYDVIFAKGDIKYLAWGLETCPKTGRLHHQGYVVFKNQRSTGAGSKKKISSLFSGNPHVEPMRGSLQQNTTYCSKVNELKEWGNRPAQGNRADLDSVVERLRKQETTAEDICLDDPVYYHMYGRTLERAEDILQRKRFRTEMTKGLWLYGPTGVGKSHRAFEGFTPETHYVKNIEDQWWDGYTGQETVILNDYRGQLTFSNLLTLVDKWPTSIKRRNREPAQFTSKLVIITSDSSPQSIYPNIDEDRMKQLLRRFDVVHIDLDSQVPVLPCEHL